VKKRELSWTGRLGGIWLQIYVSLGFKSEEERTALDRATWRNMIWDLCHSQELKDEVEELIHIDSQLTEICRSRTCVNKYKFDFSPKKLFQIKI
jgi:hypothetical protein